jgi:hypothetical protein
MEMIVKKSANGTVADFCLLLRELKHELEEPANQGAPQSGKVNAAT